VICAGDLLISPPGIRDPRFAKTVLMVAHHETTSLAFCLNRPTNYQVSQLIRDQGLGLDPDIAVYWGGPVNTQTVWMIHDPTWRMQHSIEITEDWLMTSHTEMFKPLAQGHRPLRYWVVCGCASWAPGQLDSEILGDPPWSKHHSWLTLSGPDPDWLTDTDSQDLWIASTDLCARRTVSQWMA
jgi:putative transcriptional regulator